MEVSIQITLAGERPVMLQVIECLHKAGLSYVRIAKELGISRATLYNRYLSVDRYRERRERKAQQQKPAMTRIVVSKGGRPKGSRNEKEKRAKQDHYWTKDEIKEMMRCFGGGYKQIASVIKLTIKKENKNIAIVKRLAKKFSGKPVEYICKAIRSGAYYEEMHRLEDEKWAEKHAVQQVRVTAEEMRESDEFLRNMMIESGQLVSDEQLNKTSTIDDENEFCWLAERFGVEFAMDYFREKGKKIPQKYSTTTGGDVW